MRRRERPQQRHQTRLAALAAADVVEWRPHGQAESVLRAERGHVRLAAVDAAHQVGSVVHVDLPEEPVGTRDDGVVDPRELGGPLLVDPVNAELETARQSAVDRYLLARDEELRPQDLEGEIVAGESPRPEPVLRVLVNVNWGLFLQR